MPIVPPEVGEECIVLRRDAYEKIKHLLYDDGDVDPADLPPCQRDHGGRRCGGSRVESYQKYKR